VAAPFPSSVSHLRILRPLRGYITSPLHRSGFIPIRDVRAIRGPLLPLVPVRSKPSRFKHLQRGFQSLARL
jgi:hypothetical protein